MSNLRKVTAQAVEIKTAFAENKNKKSKAELIAIVESLIALNINSLRIRAVLQGEEIDDVLESTTLVS